MPKGVPVSGGISGGIPLDWSSTGTGAQTLGWAGCSPQGVAGLGEVGGGGVGRKRKKQTRKKEKGKKDPLQHVH